MPKHLTEVLKGVKSSVIEPMEFPDDLQASEGGKEFIAKHKIEKHADRVGNTDTVYKGTTKPVVDMNHKHGYKKGEDAKVYEEKEEKKDKDDGKFSLKKMYYDRLKDRRKQKAIDKK